jgi:molecular chaperone DnaK
LNRLIKDKIDRTIECCHEALAQARQRASLRLPDVDHVVLVGGSSRAPLVRETVRAAFCNADLAEHVRSLDPLLHEPDLCVAYGAALRAATHGTRYLFSLGSGVGGQESGVRSQESEEESPELELHITSPANTRDTRYQATGVVRVRSSPDSCPLTPDPCLEGGSVRIRSLDTGLADEAFLDERGSFAQELELRAESDNPLEWTVCDGAGEEVGRVVTAVRHQGEGRPLGQAVLPTQIITKPLQIEVIGRGGQRVKQVVAPVGATLPGVFRCVCRTHDQAGRIVVPIYEENRIVKQMVLDNLDPDLPVGSPVEVEFSIDVKHAISVTVRVREGEREHSETASIEAPPPPSCPTRGQIDAVREAIEELLPRFRGAFRARMKARAEQLHQDLLEALRYEDEPRAIQRFAELKELCQQLESNRDTMLDPPWPRFEQLVRHCLDLAADVADRTGRDREELFEHVRAQERYAEQAYQEENQPLYRECRENLEKYAGYLNQLLQDSLPRPEAPRPQLPPEEEARALVERFRAFLSAVWKEVRNRQRPDLEARLAQLASQARGFSQRIKSEPHDVIRDARRLGTEVQKVADQLEGRTQTPGEDTGLLEGSS